LPSAIPIIAAGNSKALRASGMTLFRCLKLRVSPAQAGVQCIEFAEKALKNGKKIEVD